ncbi:MAG: NAD-dependent epimerase/dehydratase family protein [Candidatus Methanoperedens sp.]|jgi:UDP-glucose 4-epimerase|nr:NAD-dependent epimerase/dehydratase family protein [Candidatus Methanoperedens sp.]PKL53828.1 MAG: UDP-glucose 4-epimerase [Candidatus Methanoperedenaceae archaeon HGW-Methanoperedenaceae-1]
MKKKIIVTGGAGFIGSHIADKLLSNNCRVTVVDNLSGGRMEFLEQNTSNPDFEFKNVDLLEPAKLETAIKGADAVFHLAANPDVRLGPENTKVHLEQNIIATYNLLEAMRKNNVRNIFFTSTSTVYGEASVIPTPEDYGPLVPISLYGASKLACEALITSYCHTFKMNSWIFRFANIVGARGTHGIIVDFIEKLRKNPQSLEILGDGRQNKSYIHVSECVDAIMYAWEHSNDMVNIFNIGSNDTITATRIGEIIVEEMGLHDVKFNYTGGTRGWVGDVPKMMLSIDKLRSIGWEFTYNSENSIRDAVRSTLGKLQ